MLGLRHTPSERVKAMQALYENVDGTFSVGTVVGRGVYPWNDGYQAPVLRATVQIRFDGKDSEYGERVESLFADDRHLTLGILFGSMVSTLSAHNPEWVRTLVNRRLAR